MEVGNDSNPLPWTPSDERDREAVREQIGRIVSSALFRNSKRFPAFLRYTAEHALGSRESLKERTIGHEVFGRDAAYDTAQDPIVRMTAAEVRKRLAQYYQSPEHAAETVVAYQPGSYVPEFYLQQAREAVVADPAILEPVAPSAQRRWFPVLPLAAVAVMTLLVVFALSASRKSARSVVDRFWDPLLGSSAPVLLCIGDPNSPRVPLPTPTEARPAVPGDLTVDEFLQANSVRYTDAVTLALLSGELRARDKAFRIRRPAATELKDLRDGPVILIGGFNNPWTLKLSEGLRYTLASDPNGAYIRDRERPDSRDWQTGPRSARVKDLSQTYGLITRVADPATGHVVITLSGLVLGTRAAAECAIDAACLGAAEDKLAGAWDRQNLQIVVGATVIGEDSGAPTVLAAHLW